MQKSKKPIRRLEGVRAISIGSDGATCGFSLPKRGLGGERQFSRSGFNQANSGGKIGATNVPIDGAPARAWVMTPISDPTN